MCIVSVSGAIIIKSYSAIWSNFNNLLAPKTLSVTFGDWQDSKESATSSALLPVRAAESLS